MKTHPSIHQVIVTQRRRGQGLDPEANGMQIVAASTDLKTLGIDPDYFIGMGKHYGEVLHSGNEEAIRIAVSAEEAEVEASDDEKEVSNEVIDLFPVIWCHSRVGVGHYATTRICYVGRTPPPDKRLGNFVLHSYIYLPDALAPCGGNPLALARAADSDGNSIFFDRDPGLTSDPLWMTSLPVISSFSEIKNGGCDFFNSPEHVAYVGPLSEQLKQNDKPILLCVDTAEKGFSAVESALNLLPPSSRSLTTFTTFESYLTNLRVIRKGWEIISDGEDSNRHDISVLVGSDPDFQLGESDYTERFVINFLSDGKNSSMPATGPYSERIEYFVKNQLGISLSNWLEYIENSGAGTKPKIWKDFDWIAESLNSTAPLESLKNVIQQNSGNILASESGALAIVFLKRVSAPEITEAEKNSVLHELSGELTHIFQRAAHTSQVEEIQSLITDAAVCSFESANPRVGIFLIDLAGRASFPLPATLFSSLIGRELSSEIDPLITADDSLARLELVARLPQADTADADQLNLTVRAVWFGRTAGQHERAWNVALPVLRKCRSGYPAANFLEQFEPENGSDAQPEDFDCPEQYIFLLSEKVCRGDATVSPQTAIEEDMVGLYCELSLNPEESGEDIVRAVEATWTDKLERVEAFARIVERWMTNHPDDPMNFFFDKYVKYLNDADVLKAAGVLHGNLLKAELVKVIAREIIFRRVTESGDRWHKWLEYYETQLLLHSPIVAALLKRLCVELKQDHTGTELFFFARDFLSRDLPGDLDPARERLREIVGELAATSIRFGPVVPGSDGASLFSDIKIDELKEVGARDRIKAISLMTGAEKYRNTGAGPASLATLAIVHEALNEVLSGCSEDEKRTGNEFLCNYAESIGIFSPADALAYFAIHQSVDADGMLVKINNMIAKADSTTRVVITGCILAAGFLADDSGKPKFEAVSKSILGKFKRNSRDLIEEFSLRRFEPLSRNEAYKAWVKNAFGAKKK